MSLDSLLAYHHQYRRIASAVEVVGDGPFVITTRGTVGRRGHLPLRAARVTWTTHRRAGVMAEARCGSTLTDAAFHMELPDEVELCDYCALVDFIPAVVYRLYDRDGALLYVGSTQDLPNRLRGHLYGSPAKPYQALIDHWTYEPFGSHDEALTAEARAIIAEQPLFNIDLTDRAKHPGRRREANLHLVGAA